MKIRLVRSKDVRLDIFKQVYNQLICTDGPLQFRRCKNNIMFRESKILSWELIFTEMDSFREVNSISSEDFLVLLTSKPNEHNWFSSTNLGNGNRNIFVQTSDWEHYIECSPIDVITFQIVENILQALMFPSFESALELSHDPPIGCINDMCSWKPDITFKLRTADICSTCLERLNQQGVSDELLQQAIETFEHLRRSMLFNRRLQPEVDYDHSLPFTVATTKRKMRTTFEPLRRFLLLLDHFDSIVRTSVIILGKVCCGEQFEQFVSDAGLTGRPSLGQWVSALQVIATSPAFADIESIPLPNDFQERLQGIISRANEAKIVSYRNEYRGHGYCSLHDGMYREIYEEVLPSLQYIEKALLPLLLGFKLCYVISSANLKTGRTVKIKALMGNHPEFEDREIGIKKGAELPYDRQVYAQKEGGWYDLHPYIQYDNCPVCRHPMVLIYDGEQYLDPFVGHRVTILH